MADEFSDDTGEAEEALETNAAAIAVALDAAHDNAALSASASNFLARQSALVEEQRHHLREQLKRLKLNIFSQRLSIALKLLTALVGLAVAGALALIVRNAMNASGLVVDSFTAPPDFAARGIGGDVIAADLTTRLRAVRQLAVDNSYAASNDVSKDDDTIKVAIPETGISVSEALRALRGWLGHERHVNGSLRELDGGKIQLLLTIDGAEGVALTGAPGDLDKLEGQAAESLFGRFDPGNYAIYLMAAGRFAEGQAVVGAYAVTPRASVESAADYSLWSAATALATGDIPLAIARARISAGIDPRIAVSHIQEARLDAVIGHNEDALRESYAILPLKDADQPPPLRGHGLLDGKAEASLRIAQLTGDFANGSTCLYRCTQSRLFAYRAEVAAHLHDVTASLSLLADARAAGQTDEELVSRVRYLADADAGAWLAALADIRATAKAFAAGYDHANPRFVATITATAYEPLAATAEAHLGEFAVAHHDIDATPGDCYSCVRARGEIDALQKNWGGAAYWFADAVKQAPSIPFAYADWGAMLMQRGDLNGAIAKFAAAHEKGPHFADPLELWGEALILKNRSDLALAKFTEADKYAPNWGRLHLKWGEALWWTGDKDGAQKQFSAAARLDLSVTERTNIEHWLRAG